ncbi:triphosphoribosyl-dephospho-CoA synthase [Escherichia coli]|nr:triphosphoribosyl-dephospho-CoA synthase [Escherichia coli]
MARRWDGNQRQAKVLSARFRCIFLDNGWFRALGTSFSQALLKTQERVKTHTGAILVCLLLLCFASIARSRSFLSLIPRCLRMSSTEKMEKKQCHEVYAGKTSVIHMAE